MRIQNNRCLSAVSQSFLLLFSSFMNGDTPVTVQIKVKDVQGNESYELRVLQPGETQAFPGGTDYLRVFPGPIKTLPTKILNTITIRKTINLFHPGG